MKKIISLVLISLLLQHGISQFFVFKLFEVKYKREIKQMIKKGVPEDQLVYFSFSKSIESQPIKNFRWTKKNEFRYNNKMYDVVERKYSHDSVYYKCIHDVKESGLFANLDKHINDFIEKNPAKKKDLITILNSLSVFYSTVQSYCINNLSGSDLHYFLTSEIILEGERELISPPPKLT